MSRSTWFTIKIEDCTVCQNYSWHSWSSAHTIQNPCKQLYIRVFSWLRNGLCPCGRQGLNIVFRRALHWTLSKSLHECTQLYNPIPLRTFECDSRRAVIQAVGYKDSDRGSPDWIQVPRDVCFQQTWGKIFLRTFGPCPVSVRTVVGSKQTLTQWVLGVFPGCKAPGACWWTTPPPTPSAEVKESVDLYLYCLSVLSWQVIGWSLPLPTITLSEHCHLHSASHIR
jgi:hypothetical protein